MTSPKKLTRESQVDLGATAEVHLGDRTYVVVPQRIGYLRSKLGVVLGGLTDIDLNAGNIVEVLGDRVYGVLAVFIPDLMPSYEFAGFATQEAMAKGEYDERYDKSPSPSQIKNALMTVAEVNEIDLLKHLGKVIPPSVVKAYIAGALADSMTENLPRSLPTNGDTASTTSSL